MTRALGGRDTWALGPFTVPQGTPAPRPGPRPERPRGFVRRHRVATVLVALLVLVLVVAGGGLLYQWRFAAPRQVSGAEALQRLRSGDRVAIADPGALRPVQGVYDYTGSAQEKLSFPPLSHNEGPRFPGTVSYASDGCWTFRLDYSTLHWQSTTYCPRGGNLVESGRAGWYRWYVGAIAVSDTATFTCSEMILPTTLSPGTSFSFACRGTNTPIDTGTVLMSGTNRYLGAETLRVGGTSVACLHFREDARLTAGQTGTSTADTWVSTADGLPVKGTWSTTVRSPSPLGTSTLTGTGSFALSSLHPKR
jgi:hypothetical protein